MCLVQDISPHCNPDSAIILSLFDPGSGSGGGPFEPRKMQGPSLDLDQDHYLKGPHWHEWGEGEASEEEEEGSVSEKGEDEYLAGPHWNVFAGE